MEHVTDSAVTVDLVGDAIIEIGLRRPPVNALSTRAYEQISDAFRAVGARSDIKVVVLRSHLERVFCAGADLDELTAIVEGRAELSDVTRQGVARQMLDAITDTPQVTIAAI